MKVVPFVASSEDREAVKKLLADITAKIEAGEIRGLAIAAVENDGTSWTGWSGGLLVELLGSVARLAHRINLEVDSW